MHLSVEHLSNVKKFIIRPPSWDPAPLQSLALEVSENRQNPILHLQTKRTVRCNKEFYLKAKEIT